ncbi:PREDICTED: disease susceptibility protein LOV1-like [Fragaria vesca subsp. vesca]|uniref:disease susceptibility protein LOV1-like n=1 Tax=Fragaria vesca subsp. vesca TaxID=101020 RepID=UPI0002C2EBC8|nr:PREDICTED: disease susceptibility protein LOV1-like [Fragaria vesca subsp. vesca]
MQEKSERFQAWKSQIREVAFDAEVLIETYISEAAGRTSWRKVLQPIHLRKIRRKIEDIEARMDVISKQKESFGISGNNQDGGEAVNLRDKRLQCWRHPSPNVQEDDLVDLVDDTTALITQLSSMDRSRCVVSIVGMGGLGKTTLAKKLYHHPQLGKQFACRSFVYVSQEYKRREILQKIIEDVRCPHDTVDLEKVEEKKMVEMLHKFLRDKRYLVVLDDIWTKELWDGLKDAFPSGEMGSKVLLTTRFIDVAVYADPRSVPHEPRMLTDNESLELFLMKTRPGVVDIPSNLQTLGKKMVAKCAGLPLAVVVLGGLLSTKSDAEWERVVGNISWHLLSAEVRVSYILALSYDDLLPHLKSCFHHLALFPEDSSIEKKYLIRLWVAEGFLPQQGQEIEEGVAENCLNELLNRCMIQVATRTSLGNVKTIRIHDVLRDFSLTKGREHFLEIFTDQGNESTSASHHSTKFRRIAIHAAQYPYEFLNPITHLRSLHFFGEDHEKMYCTRKNFKLLRVLELYCKNRKWNDLRECSVVGDLIQLRFLRLRGGKNAYNTSLSSLKNLQTLDMRFCGSYLMFKELKIQNLRHLLLPEHYPVDLALGTMTHLQTLKGIEGGRWIEDGLAKMINLRRLMIRTLSRDGVTLVISIVEKLRYLQSLSLTNHEFGDELFPPLEGLSRCDHLQKLRLCGKLEKLPHVNGFPRNLIKLVLMRSNLHRDSIVILERLPNLKMLSMEYGSYPFRELVCSSEGFPQLQFLHLIQEDLEVWRVEERALQKLRQLTTVRCSKLRQVPGLKLLTTLQELNIFGSPGFEDMLRTNEDLIEFTRINSIKLVQRYNFDYMKWSAHH